MFELDWKQAPQGARWWAMDADGRAHWYCEPATAAFTSFWYADMKDAPSFGFDGDWTGSLEERPRHIDIGGGRRRVRRVEIPNSQIKDSADDFERARKVLVAADRLAVEENGQFSGTARAQMNVAIVAVELYLKSLCSEEQWTELDDGSGMSKVTAEPTVRNHRLVKQLNRIDGSIREQLEREFHSAFPSGPPLGVCLKSMEGIFEWSRYSFHRDQPHDFRYQNLMNISDFLMGFVGALKPRRYVLKCDAK